MDLDYLDLDAEALWALDQMALAPPLRCSSSKHLRPPLWAFSDAGREDEPPSSLVAAPIGLSEYPLLLACTHRSLTKDATEGENGYDSLQFPSPYVGVMPDNPDGYCAIKERMSQALRFFKESTQQHVLAQVWAPVKKGGRFVLTTSGQPFVLDPTSNGLNQYRMVSLMYTFSVDGNTDGELGLPGRVFLKKSPEWTPNVQYYSSKEFSRLVHALNYNVQGTLALPVFEPYEKSCLGVVELIMTSQKINYAPEVEKVCKALEAVNLKTSEILEQKTTQICNKGRQNALAEVLEILTVVCETHKLPLAQTWVPCKHRSILADGGGLRKTCSSFDGSCIGNVCMSTSDIAFYIVDARMWGFREACVEHHLQRGQGVAGSAFSSGNMSLCRDVSRFCKTQYPLVHYARMFRLTSCFAICLKSDHTGDDNYVLEFFLPPSITDDQEIDNLLGLILGRMKQHFRSLKLASGNELGEDEAFLEIVEALADERVHSRLESFRIYRPPKSTLVSNTSPNKDDLEALHSDPGNIQGNAGVSEKHHTSASHSESEDVKILEKKRGKAERAIGLDVLQQYFSGSLKDAAKSLGVCPTTMKRICRQHGISRWPSRKISKVNRSLTQLKHVMESVRGSDRAISSNPSTPTSIAVDVPWFSNPRMVDQQKTPSAKAPETQAQTNHSLNFPSLGNEGEPLERRVLRPGHVFHIGNGFTESSMACNRSKTGVGSKEENSETEASLGSCEANPANEGMPAMDHVSASTNYHSVMDYSSKELRSARDFDLSTVVSYPCPLSTNIPQEQSKEMTAEAAESKSISVKVTYRDNILRFRIPMGCSIVELKEGVGKRLKLDTSTFYMRYMDDDREWVLIACDADLHECFDVSISSGSSVIRLSVHEVVPCLGSSCESTGQRL